MRVLFDTNVLISAFVFKGFSAKVYDHSVLFAQIFTSNWLLAELEEKLRDKFNVPQRDISEIISIIKERATVVSPTSHMPDILRDKDDNHVLRAAVESNVDYLVTGDKEMLSLKKYEGVIIVSPREFSEIFLS